ncbi:hypothetical protein GYMLUDRAFT_56736 [Collybiopsis luxurians FD-317 M1]|nr:hypothetical protein GYMLUDRAFT_56736 [Collybiopsis luxurians FD-317 M1]
MFVVHTGHMFEMGIQFVNNQKSRYQTVDAKFNLQAQVVEAVLVRTNYLLSDFVVVWRAWSLSACKPRLKSRYILSFCLFASFGLTLAALSKQRGYGHPLPLGVGSTFYQVGLRIPLPVVLFITNIVATGYIGVIFWEFQNAMRGYMEPSKRIANVRQTLYFMFESGFLYSMIWIVIFFDIVFRFPPEASIALGLITPQITAIYPTLIVSLNATQKSFWDESGRDSNPTRSVAMSQANRPNTLLTTQVQDTGDFPLETISTKSQIVPESSPSWQE